MSDCFILLSAGKSKRFKSKINKQFITYKNRPLFEHSLQTAINSKLFKRILSRQHRRQNTSGAIKGFLRGLGPLVGHYFTGRPGCADGRNRKRLWRLF